ncbi:uncharacterized protein LOC124253198 [Haliotis rubra]|uniref:uncharacterized protein LOC124253198 n=1 Tax=Haliotis rubra TaxID=36100 RepID=UPI001EE53141|nr:uncharacterized protein LOC124253198 [Haliotis rubra]
MKDVDKRTDETEKMYAVLATVILGLPGLLREESKTFIAEDWQGANTVPSFIVCDGGAEEAFTDVSIFHVYSEGQKVCTTDNIIDALKVYLAVYYVFNLQYPQGLSKTHLFFDKMLLKIKNKPMGRKTLKTKSFEKSVNSLISKLNATN